MDPGYALHYRELYRSHWWWRARERLILSTIEEIRRDGSRGAILDIGCGDGLLFDRLSQFGDVEGVETDPSLVSDDGPWRSKIHISPFNRAFQSKRRYSLILMLDVLEHLDDPRNCLTHALDLLDRDGTLLLTVPAFPCLWTSHDDLNRHFRRYTKESLIELMSEVGINTFRCRYFFAWTFPVKLFLHYRENLLGANPRIPRVPPQWLNEALFQISILEQRLLANTPMPFGGSLIATGRKR
jgi:SAM-dependent methyltransferase